MGITKYRNANHITYAKYVLFQQVGKCEKKEMNVLKTANDDKLINIGKL